MANLVNFSTYGFLDDILALNEDNWRKFFKPIIYDSVQGGLEVTTGTGMTVNVSAGECRCGSIMGISNSQVSLDVNVGDNTYNRIDSVVIQYVQGDPSTLSIAILEGEPSASPVPPTLTKSYNSLWQMEIAQIFVPSNVTTASQCTITDKRIIYNSIDSVIDPINESIDDINNEIQNINEDIENIDKNKLNNSVIAPVFSTTATYAVGDVVTYNGKLYKFTSSHSAGSWNSSEVTETTTWYEKADNSVIAPVFSETGAYEIDDCVIHQGKLYRFFYGRDTTPWDDDFGVVETNVIDQVRQNILYYQNLTVSPSTGGVILRIPESGEDHNITENTVVLDANFGDTVTSNVLWSSSDGVIFFTGTCTAVTFANVVLGRGLKGDE